MEKLISNETELDLTKIGLYQIVGGALGPLIVLWVIIFRKPILTDLPVYIFLLIVSFLVFAYSIFCGILCLKTKKNALVHSLTNQILQAIGFAVMGFTFKYVAGFYLTIGLNFTDSIEFGFGIGISVFHFDFNSQSDIIKVDLNLVALALIFWIDKLMRKVKKEVATRQTSSIGDK
jgi:hypothetical protein